MYHLYYPKNISVTYGYSFEVEICTVYLYSVYLC